MRILHCSDVHITENYWRLPLLRLGWRRWIAMAELEMGGRKNTYRNSGGTLRRLALEGLKADHVVLSGDLTAYSLPQEFQGAKEALSPLMADARRLSIIPGNHDRYTPGAYATKRFEQYFGAHMSSDLPEHAVEDGFPFVRLLEGDAAVVGLCSARVPKVPGMSWGVIGEKQFGALRRVLDDPRLAGRAVFVAVHHGPYRANGSPDKFSHGLREHERLLAMLPGPRFAVLHGHIHHRYHHPATERRPHIFCAGSSTQLGHEGYWLIETQNGVIQGFEKRALTP
jgi:3',5'-cyclic AMP phosphodiesterase CpdA